MTILVWEDAQTNKPPEFERVLLKIKNSNNPVVGYFRFGWWEVCTDNVCTPAGLSGYAHKHQNTEPEGNFIQDDVLQYARLGL